MIPYILPMFTLKCSSNKNEKWQTNIKFATMAICNSILFDLKIWMFSKPMTGDTKDAFQLQFCLFFV